MTALCCSHWFDICHGACVVVVELEECRVMDAHMHVHICHVHVPSLFVPGLPPLRSLLSFIHSIHHIFTVPTEGSDNHSIPSQRQQIGHRKHVVGTVSEHLEIKAYPPVKCRAQEMKCIGALDPPCRRCRLVGAICEFVPRANQCCVTIITCTVPNTYMYRVGEDRRDDEDQSVGSDQSPTSDYGRTAHWQWS